jgi:hypothetical protein
LPEGPYFRAGIKNKGVELNSMRKATPRHFINIRVPISHRMGDIKPGTVNKYRRAEALANKFSRNSVDGGGYGFGSNDYEIVVAMPQDRVTEFKVALRAEGIRYSDYGVLPD